MSGAPRTRRTNGRERPTVLRSVMKTVLASAVVLVLGFAAGQLIGRALL
jgi:hypothetical protein